MKLENKIVRVPIGEIKPSAFNPRKTFDETSLKELASTIKAEGIQVPLELFPLKKGYEIIDGERRYRAAKLLKLSDVPAIIKTEVTETQARKLRLISFDQRVDLTPWERAQAYQQMLDAGMTLDELAIAIGKSLSTVRGIARLGRAPKALQEALADGTVPVETAKLVCAVPNPTYREKLSLHVIGGDRHWSTRHPDDYGNGPLSYRQTKEIIQNSCMIELKAAAFDPADAKLLPGVGTCAECPKRVGNLKATEPELYEGARDDMCMDPGCYRDKLDAAGKQKIAAAKEIGRKVLSASESNALFEQWSPDRVRYDCPYIDLDESASRETHGENNKRFRTMLAKELDTVITVKKNGSLAPMLSTQVVIAIDRTGKSHDLLPRDVAAPLLKKLGVKISVHKPKKDPVYKPMSDAQRKEAEAVRLRKVQVENEIALECCRRLGDIAVKVFSQEHVAPAAETFLRTFLHRVDLYYGPVAEYCAEVLGVENGMRDVETAIDKAALPKLWRLLAANLFDMIEADDNALKEFGVDRKKIEQEVRNRLNPQDQSWRKIPLYEALGPLPMKFLNALSMYANLGDLADAIDNKDHLPLAENEVKRVVRMMEVVKLQPKSETPAPSTNGQAKRGRKPKVAASAARST